MFKEGEGDRWLYPKLLLVVAACFALSFLLSLRLPAAWAVGVGFVPFYVLMAFAARPLSYREWARWIAISVCVLVMLALISAVIKAVIGA